MLITNGRSRSTEVKVFLSGGGYRRIKLHGGSSVDVPDGIGLDRPPKKVLVNGEIPVSKKVSVPVEVPAVIVPEITAPVGDVKFEAPEPVEEDLGLKHTEEELKKYTYNELKDLASDMSLNPGRGKGVHIAAILSAEEE